MLIQFQCNITFNIMRITACVCNVQDEPNIEQVYKHWVLKLT